MAGFLRGLGKTLGDTVDTVIGNDGLVDDLLHSDDPLGLEASTKDTTTIIGNVFGDSGVVDDLLFTDDGKVEAVLKDIAGDGGILDNTVNDQGLGYEELLGEETVLGNIAGHGGTLDAIF